MSKKVTTDALRKHYVTLVKELLGGAGEEVLTVGSNEFAIPCIDGEGEDAYVTVTIKIPSGSRDGDPYDGYAMAQDYEMKQKEKAEKAKKAAEDKARKIARDEAARKQKAEAKAKREG